MRYSPTVLFLMTAALGCRSVPSDSETSDTDRGELLGIGLTPNNPSIEVGGSVQFRAEAFYADTTNEDVTDEVQWIVSDDRIATISARGEASARSQGTTNVIAQLDDGMSAQVQLTVRGVEQSIESVDITPNPLSVSVGQTATLTATARYEDDSTGNIAASCSWTSEDAAVASVDALGVVSGAKVGSTVIRAGCAGSTYDIDVNVTDGSSGAPNLRLKNFTSELYGSDLLFTADVENTGSAPASGFTVAAFLDRDSAPTSGSGADDSSFVGTLAAGATTSVVFVVLDVSAGSYQAWLLADSTSAVTESNESDNIAGPLTVSVTGSGPNIQITSFEGLSDGSDTLWSVDIKNTGTRPTGGFWMDLFHDVDSTPAAGEMGDEYQWIPNLDPGETYTWEPTYGGGPIFGSWNSYVYADSAAEVEESDENDNSAQTAVTPL